MTDNLNIMWMRALRRAQDGRNVMICGERLACMSVHVGQGQLFVRGFQESTLKSVSVSTVFFVGKIPYKIRRLIMERTQSSSDMEVFEA